MPRGVKTARSVNKAPGREFVTRDCDGTQAYATVIKTLGNGRMHVRVEADDAAPARDIQCTVRGSMRRREWVNLNDVVLVAFREFGDTHDIIRKYSEAEVAVLRRLGELRVSTAAAAAGDDDPTAAADDQHDIVFEDI